MCPQGILAKVRDAKPVCKNHGLDEAMRLLRSPWRRAFLAWTVISLIMGVVLALDALNGISRAHEACFFQTGPCPELGNPDFVQLDFAFFGVPSIWMVGVLMGIIGRALAGRR